MNPKITEYGEARRQLKLRDDAIFKIKNVNYTGIRFEDGQWKLHVGVTKKLPEHDKLLNPAINFSGLPLIFDEIGEIKTLAADRKISYRPCPPGVSIGHYAITAGTFGVTCFKDNVKYILSNNHVLANMNDGWIGDTILQPGAYDGGTDPADKIGTLAAFVPIYFNDQRYLNYVDCAIALPVNTDDLLDNILELGYPAGSKEAVVGMTVVKSGRTTGVVAGTITEFSGILSVGYGDPGTAYFDDQIITTPILAGGDSGSCLLDDDDHKAVGLCFAGADTFSVANRMTEVVAALGIIIFSGAYHPTPGWGGGFVAVSYGEARAASSPDGITWTARILPSLSNWISVAYGNGMWVTVAWGNGDTSTATAASSPDGVRWTTRILPTSGATGWYAITYGNGMFVAVAETGECVSSPDGITWTARTFPSGFGARSVAYGNNLFVAVGFCGVAATSPDGITWTARTLPKGHWQYSSYWSAITYGNGLFVVVEYGSDVTITSPDGITWTSGMTIPFSYWNSVGYGDGLFVAVANIYEYEHMAAVATSPDGITWTVGTLPRNYWKGITYGDGTFMIIIAEQGYGRTAVSSPDGFTWTERIMPYGYWHAVAYGPPWKDIINTLHSFPWWKQLRALCKVKEVT